jgi:uncharacterized protein (DUF433 family)
VKGNGKKIADWTQELQLGSLVNASTILLAAEAKTRLNENQAMPSGNSIIAADPEVLGGTPDFCGTRVPFQALLDYLEGRQTLAEFLDDFPSVTRDMAVSALEQAKTLLVK